MTQAKTLSVAFLGCLLAAGCATDDQSDSMDEGGGDGDDSGDNYTGTDNNSGGPDEDDAGADVEPTYPTEHPRIYINKHRDRLKAALDAGTPAATKFKSAVDQWMGGADIYGFQTWNVALLGQVTGDAQYCAKAVTATDAKVNAENAKAAAGQIPDAGSNSYLHVGEVVGDVVLVYDWCFDAVNPAQRTKWVAYMNQALTNLWNPTQATWGGHAKPWTGWSLNDPLNNYHYSFLTATMLVGLATKGEDSKGDEWIKKFRDEKVLGALVPAFEEKLRGGGSAEGSGYGQSLRSLWRIYDIWYATTGEKLQAKTKHARQSLRQFIHHIVPTLDRVSPNGDQSRDMTAMLFDYHRHYLIELIDMYPNDPVSARAKALLEGSTLPQMARRELFVWDFLYDNAKVTSKPLDGLGKSYFASGVGQLYARSGWDKSATWVNFSAGPYREDHAHQDQGSFLIYKDGWLAYDGVINSANGIIQDTGSHSLVRINRGGTPIKQKVRTEPKMVGVHAGDGWVYASADVTAAYGGDPGITKVQRELIYLEPNTVVVYDRVATGGDTTQTWQLATPVSPAIAGASATIKTSSHTLKVDRLVPASGVNSSAYSLASTADYRGGFRLDTAQAGGDRRYLHVLSIDGSVTTATADGDNGATIKLSGGETATVKFNRDDSGATLTYKGKTSNLGPGFDNLPE